MPIFVKTVGIIIACITAIAIFSPGTMRRAVGFFREGKRLYAAAGCRVVLGAALIWASFYCAVTGVVLAIGIIVLVAGGVGIALGLQRMQGFVDWAMARSDDVLRLMAAVSFVFGAALVYAA